MFRGNILLSLDNRPHKAIEPFAFLRELFRVLQRSLAQLPCDAELVRHHAV